MPEGRVDLRIDEPIRHALIEWVRALQLAHLAGREPPPAPALPPGLRELSLGAFVTLTLDGALRGCIGQLTPETPLISTLRRTAVSAAISDPRFPPMTPSELERSQVELSVVSPLCPLERPEDIVIGRHGVVVRQGRRSGVYLPSVAPRLGWNAVQLLEETSRKAGLAADAWRTATVQLFTTLTFGEGMSSAVKNDSTIPPRPDAAK